MAVEGGGFDWEPIRVAYLRGDSDSCRTLLERAPEPEALVWKGRLDVREAQYDRAIATLLRCHSPDTALRAERDVWLGRAYANTGEYGMAHSLIERARACAPAHSRTEFRAAYARALTYFLAQQYDDAQRTVDDLLACEDPEYRAQAYALSGWIAARREQLREQLAHLLNCFAEYETVEEPVQYAYAHNLVVLASLCREMPVPETRERVRRYAARVPRTNGIAGAYFQLSRVLGWIDALAGDEISAMRHWHRAEEVAPSDFWLVFCLVDRAYLARAAGRSQFAQDALQAAHAYASRLTWSQTQDEERIILLTIAQLFAEQQPALAQRYLAMFRSLSTSMDPRIGWAGDRRTRALQLYPQGVALLRLGEREAALDALELAWHIFTSCEYGWRAALAALELYKATKNGRWLEHARRQSAPWPNSWIARDALLADLH